MIWYRLHVWPIWLLLGLMFLAACQSDALPDETGGGEPIVAHSDSSYINLRIVNNQIPMTRATEAATAKENAIYDGILCIFEGDNESTAQLKTAVVIDQLINNPGNSTSIDITQRLAIGTHAYSPNIYVLALLNTTSTGFKVGGVNNNELLFDGVSKKNATISQIQNLVIHSVGSTEEHVGLFMSNAPQEGSIMPRVASSYLYDTEQAATAGSRLTINVERAAARVKVTNGSPTLSINLDGDENRHPTVHRLTWALNNYNTQSFAIRYGSTAAENWATSISGTPISFDTTVPDVFDLYKQHSYKDGDAVYIAENTTDDATDQTEVIVEVQLKEGSFLLGDCYRYWFWGEDPILFTSAEKFIKYCKDGWKEKFSINFTAIRNKSAEEVFKYPSFVINNNGSVTLTLTNDSFTTDEKDALVGLSNTLSGLLTGYRDGKMYYTTKIKHSDARYGVVRNNAYNLNVTTALGIGDPVPIP